MVTQRLSPQVEGPAVLFAEALRRGFGGADGCDAVDVEEAGLAGLVEETIGGDACYDANGSED